MEKNNYPENILASIDSLLALRFQAAGTFHKSYKKSSAIMSGNFASPFRGRGIDFSEVRLYEPGDDVRTIDWRVTARTGKPHTKLFVEERERPVLFVIDCSSSMQFGTQSAFKSVIASKCAALLAWSATKHGDRVGGILFAGTEHEELKPVGGKRGILKFFRQLVGCNQRQLEAAEFTPATNYKDIIFRLKRIARPGSLIYFISDFNGMTKEDTLSFSQIATHCELVLIHVYDNLEKNAPPAGQYRVSDGTHVGVVNVDNKVFPQMINKVFSHQLNLLETLHRQYGIHYFSIATNDDVQQTVRDNLTHKMLNAL